MGWIKDGVWDHEGWVNRVLADGRVADLMAEGGVVVREVTAADVAAGWEIRPSLVVDGDEVVVPWDQVAIWRVACECGWSGSELPAVTDPGNGTRICPEDVADTVFGPEWDAHVAPFAALGDLAQLHEQQRDLDVRIADTVRLARTGGASWTQVGRAVGLSKQGAQQRWG